MVPVAKGGLIGKMKIEPSSAFKVYHPNEISSGKSIACIIKTGLSYRVRRRKSVSTAKNRAEYAA
jgi:hypothetical protein